ncbi:DUF1918 domain-containing protein [Pseudonocardia acaciae]|uniref:DUF1918 domain-containing protein n=1 Tax=Pseudonocardia acaciae TaxID=551276 RepID=UPI0009FFAC92|nr:DUF1918 domain-containing protein [Pseudonocardia acaciae]
MMHAQVGDWLVVPPGPGTSHPRRGQIVGLLHPDGTPPYRVRWLSDDNSDDHVSIIYPPPDAQLRVARPESPLRL